MSAASRPFNFFDPREWSASSLQTANHRIEIIVDGETPYKAFKKLAQVGAKIPQCDGQLAKYLESHACYLDLEDIDFGFHSVIESGPYTKDGVFTVPSFGIQHNVMGRLGTVSMEVDVPQAQSKTVVVNDNGSFGNLVESTRMTSMTTSTLAYLKLRSVGITGLAQVEPFYGGGPTGLELPTHYYHYYERTHQSAQPLVVGNPFGQAIKVRFSIPIVKPVEAWNRLDSCIYDASQAIQTPFEKHPTISLAYLDDSKMWGVSEIESSESDGLHGSIAEAGTLLNCLDPDLAAAFSNVKLPIRILLSIRPITPTFQPYSPHFPNAATQ